MIRRLGFVAVVALATGCAGPAVYDNGIRHCYLCAVRVARVNGYEVREQDFHPTSGELVAARSMPDIREAEVKRSWFRRTREVMWNLWEHGKFEAWDADVASERVRSEERMTVKFSSRATGPLGWLGVTRKDKTKVKLGADFTEYAREDWVISRRDLDPATRERLLKQMRDCLGLAKATEYTRAVAAGGPVAVAAVPATTPAPVVPAVVAPTGPAAASSTTLASAAVPVSATAGFFAPAGLGALPSASAPSGAAASGTVLLASAVVSATVTTAAPPVVVRLTKLSPDRIAEILKQGKAAYEGGKYKDAIPLLAQVAAADPESAESLVYLAASYYQEKRLDDAIAAYEAYLKLAPDDLRSKSFLEELRREKAGG